MNAIQKKKRILDPPPPLSDTTGIPGVSVFDLVSRTNAIVVEVWIDQFFYSLLPSELS